MTMGRGSQFLQLGIFVAGTLFAPGCSSESLSGDMEREARRNPELTLVYPNVEQFESSGVLIAGGQSYNILEYNDDIPPREWEFLSLPENDGLRESVLGVDIISAHRSTTLGEVISRFNYDDPFEIDGKQYFIVGKMIVPRNISYGNIINSYGDAYIDPERSPDEPPTVIFRTCTFDGEAGSTIAGADGNPTNETQYLLFAVPGKIYDQDWKWDPNNLNG